MADAAGIRTSAYAQVRIREPAGERTFGETPTLGGAGADIVVPGAAAGPAIRITRQSGSWFACPADGTARIGGQPLSAARDLRLHDVLMVGDAHIAVTTMSRTLLCLDVHHNIGNSTVAPSDALFGVPIGGGDDELIIESLAGAPADPVRPILASARMLSKRVVKWLAAGLAAMLIGIALISQMHPVRLDVWPEDANVRVPGTLLAAHVGSRLLMFPGVHHVLAERVGFVTAERSVVVGNGPVTVHLRLAKLPGKLHVDTAGVAASISVDGADAGQAPGSIDVSPGQHTIVLRVPRYVDEIRSIEIEGGGAQQELQVRLRPSWGTMQISAGTSRAHVTVDGVDRGPAPVIVSAPSGVHRLQISAAGAKSWESSVVLKAGEALLLGPVTLGAPDAHLKLTSTPPGAEVTVAGSLRGHTPIELDLSSGIGYEVNVSSPGFAPWIESVFAAAGQRMTIDVPLAPVTSRLTIQGEPEDALLSIDDVVRGRTPLSLDLTVMEHRIEVRKPGWAPYAGVVTPAKDLDRVINYRLTPAESRDDSAASVIYTQTGYALKLFRGAPLNLSTGSGTNRAALAGRVRNTIAPRSYYLGIATVSNDQYRRYRPDHGTDSGVTRGPDDARQPVTEVNWNDAAEYCNWLSERDNLAPAYQRRDATYVLRNPVTIGYRLPSEVEWEFAARNGLNEISGRVLEWMNDAYVDPASVERDERHVVRGANWTPGADREARIGWREGRDSKGPAVGFRIARYAQ